MNSEKENIKLFKDGSTKAFEELYNLYYARLYGYCLQWTKSQTETNDVLQDVFTKLWVHRENISDESTLIYYIFRITKNHLINIYRKNVQSPIFEEYVKYVNELTLSNDGVADPIYYDDFLEKINRIKVKLPRTQQQVFEASVLLGKTNKEIAIEFGLSEQTVKNQRSLALKVFRAHLDKYYYMFIMVYILIK